MTAPNSLFLAHVSDKLSMESISRAFHNRDIGLVQRIEWIPNKTQDDIPYKTCFVFFLVWYDTYASLALRANISGRDSRDTAPLPKFYFRGDENVKGSPYWKVAANTSSTAAYPPNRHVDLEVRVDAHVMHESVLDMIEQLDIGKVLRISSVCSGADAREDPDLLRRPSRDPREMVLPYPHDMVRYRVQFEYWHRNLAAVQFQHRLFDAAAQLEADLKARSCESYWLHPSPADSASFVCVKVSDCMVLKLYAREASTEGKNPFIWVNPELPALPRSPYRGVAATTPAGADNATIAALAKSLGAEPSDEPANDSSPPASDAVVEAPVPSIADALAELKDRFSSNGLPSVAWVACKIRSDRRNAYLRAHGESTRHLEDDAELDSIPIERRICYMFRHRALKYHAGFIEAHGLAAVAGPERAPSERTLDSDLNCMTDPFTRLEIDNAISEYERDLDNFDSNEDIEREERYLAELERFTDHGSSKRCGGGRKR